jgi:hypothetical protein
MPFEMRNVYSSHVAAVGYDPAANILRVEWQTGKTSLYHGVPVAAAMKVMDSPSIGEALRPIKAQYRHSYE